jgi:hypothetical protein
MSNEPDIAEPAPGLTFKEKTLWVTLISTLVLYAYYFWRVVDFHENPWEAGDLFFAVILIYGAIHVVVLGALAAYKRPEKKDQRDREIAQKGARNAYFVLQAGVWGALGVAALSFGAFWFIHAALLAVVIAEVVYNASQLVYYRRGM